MKIPLTYLLLLLAFTSCQSVKSEKGPVMSAAQSLGPGNTREDLYRLLPPVSPPIASTQIILGLQEHQDALFIREVYETKGGYRVETNWNYVNHSITDSLKAKLRKAQTNKRPSVDDILNTSITERQLEPFANRHQFISDQNPDDELLMKPRVHKP